MGRSSRERGAGARDVRWWRSSATQRASFWLAPASSGGVGLATADRQPVSAGVGVRSCACDARGAIFSAGCLDRMPRAVPRRAFAIVQGDGRHPHHAPRDGERPLRCGLRGSACRKCVLLEHRHRHAIGSDAHAAHVVERSRAEIRRVLGLVIALAVQVADVVGDAIETSARVDQSTRFGPGLRLRQRAGRLRQPAIRDNACAR